MLSSTIRRNKKCQFGVKLGCHDTIRLTLPLMVFAARRSELAPKAAPDPSSFRGRRAFWPSSAELG